MLKVQQGSAVYGQGYWVVFADVSDPEAYERGSGRWFGVVGRECGFQRLQVDLDRLEGARAAAGERQEDHRRDAAVRHERQALDRLLVSLDHVGAGRLRLVDPAQPERLREGDGLAFGAQGGAGLDANLVGAGARHLPVRLVSSRHRRPAILHDEIAAVVGRGRLEEGNALGEKQIALRLIGADRGQRRDDVGARALVGHHLGLAAGHPAAPREADSRERDRAAGGAVERGFQPFWG